MKAAVDANLFRLIETATSTEETRYYLNGVAIEPHPEGGAILVATDGHRMIVAHDIEGSCDGKIIVKLPRFALAQCKTPKMFTAKRVVEVDDAGTATIVEITPGNKPEDEPKRTPLLTAHNTLIDGTFPEWRRVVPSGGCRPEDARPTFFQPKYLKVWGEIGVEMGRSVGGSGSLQIGLSNGGEPVLIRWTGVETAFGIQMPMRGDVRGALPAFMTTTEFQAAAE